MTEQRQARIKSKATETFLRWLRAELVRDDGQLQAAKKAHDEDGIVWYETQIALLNKCIAEVS